MRQGAETSPPAVETISLDGAIPGNPVIEFTIDNDLYGVRATCAGPRADLLRRKILEVKDEIVYSIKVNRALLSPKTCFCATCSVLERLQDPAFKLTLDGVVNWQNETAAAGHWREVYSAGLGKPFTLHQDCEQVSLRAALADLSAAPDIPARLLPISVPSHSASAIMALRIERSRPFASPWVELFQPPPQAVAVIRGPDSKPNLSPATIRHLYGLTAKEAELAIAMAQGESLRNFADRTGVTHETARWHSKRVMQKMDCARQQDVMFALLYRNALFSILN